MNFTGERFRVPLDDNDYDDPEDEYDAFEQAAVQAKSTDVSAIPPLIAAVKDIQDRPVGQKPPIAPTLTTSTNGQPLHKKRYGVSRFKQAQTQQAAASPPLLTATAPTVNDSTTNGLSFEQREKATIDEENRRALAGMSDEAIERERAELLERLPPSLVDRMLRRANINTDTGPEDFPQQDAKPASIPPFASADDTRDPDDIALQALVSKRVTFDEPSTEMTEKYKSPHADEEMEAEEDNQPIDDASHPHNHQHPPGSIHFPHPPTAPALDPSSPSFLTDLHTKYFPSLPSDPSKLAWMTDPSTLPSYESSYSPSLESLPATSLRFSFRGLLIPPRTALDIPVTQGLHHHGDAPESAGYTIPELAHLARSAYAAQRCVAYQTLGRILYRLGMGEFGDMDHDLSRGLLGCVEQGKVLKTLHDEMERVSGHQSAKAYATEAIWLWQKGGGTRLKAQ